jgi:hypothetical protein
MVNVLTGQIKPMGVVRPSWALMWLASAHDFRMDDGERWTIITPDAMGMVPLCFRMWTQASKSRCMGLVGRFGCVRCI